MLRQIGLGIALAVVANAAAAGGSVVRITNHSHWAFHQLFLSSTKDKSWGPDQLGNQVINSGESFDLSGVPCDSYDVRLVDEDGDECVVPHVKLCTDDLWTVNDQDLLGCQAASK